MTPVMQLDEAVDVTAEPAAVVAAPRKTRQASGATRPTPLGQPAEAARPAPIAQPAGAARPAPIAQPAGAARPAPIAQPAGAARPPLPLDRTLARVVAQRANARLLQRYRSGPAGGPLWAKPDDAVAAYTLVAGTTVDITGVDLLGLYGPTDGERLWINVKVTSGTHAGKTGWVQQRQIGGPTVAKAKELWKDAVGGTFTDSGGTSFPIPFGYPVDGCYARAHLMAAQFKKAGFESEKIFAEARKTRLVVPSDLAADVAVDAAPTVEWGYHVAPVITLDTGDRFVIDPSLFDRPVTVAAWLAKMGASAFPERSVESLAKLADKNALPVEDFYYFARRSQYFPVSSGGHKAGREGDVLLDEPGADKGGRDRLAHYTKYVPYHAMARDIRQILRAGGPTMLAHLGKVFARGPAGSSKNFEMLFPNLMKQVKRDLGPTDSILLLYSYK